ncbi:MAG: hypothetical protein WEC75_03655 [Dehalococcoidia bacterium]
MTVRSWPLAVRDATRRIHAGVVEWRGALPKRLTAPRPPLEFRVVLLALDVAVHATPARTAVCVPGVPKVHALRKLPPQTLPESIDDLTLPPPRMAAFAAGDIVTAGDLSLSPADVFPAHSDHPRLDRLALALIEAAAEALAPYVAVMRHTLGLRTQADALAELEARLNPVDPASRPPARAPGVQRLRRALRDLRAGRAPDVSLDVMAADLRFLRLFAAGERTPWREDELERLFADVMEPPATARKRRPRARPATVTPFRTPARDG